VTKILASLLRELRESQGASLREAARDLGVDPAHLSRLERGAKPASSSILDRASRYYSIDREKLELARGDIPGDVVRILIDNPAVLEELRSRYGSE
jgi:transcriptional regulator with XRE-family HTH domain